MSKGDRGIERGQERGSKGIEEYREGREREQGDRGIERAGEREGARGIED